jgi:hypothetical protein
MELPLRLLISVAVAGLTAPAVLGGLSAYEAEAASASAMRAIDAVVRAAQAFYLAGDGAEDVRVDLGGGVTARVEFVSIGDAPGGARMPTASYKVSGQAVAFLLTDPPVPMAADGGPLRLGTGPHTVRVSYDGSGPVRLVEVP